MIAALAAVPFLAAVLLHFGARPLAERVVPSVATWLLSAATLTVSLTCGLVLAVASYVSLAQVPFVAQLGHWSVPALRGAGSLPVPVGVVTSLAVISLLVAAIWRVTETMRAFLVARATVTGLPRSGSSLIVVDDPVPSAFAVAGRTGYIVVSAGMLHALDNDERRVLLAHEEAHLRYRHHLFVWITAVAAAANPLLHNNIALVRMSIERWADESAARQVGDRATVARGVARAALVRAGAHSRGHAVAAAGIADGDVVGRVRALLAPAPSPRRGVALLVTAAALASWVATVVVLRDAHAMIEIGESAYRR